MNRKHNSTLTIRLPKEEKAVLNNRAENSRLSLSAFIRSKILKDSVKDFNEEENQAAS